MVTQLAREAGAYVIGTGRAADRQKALDFGAQEFVDLDNDALVNVGGIDLVLTVEARLHKARTLLVEVLIRQFGQAFGGVYQLDDSHSERINAVMDRLFQRR